jgi:hypothetical protein
MITRYHRLHTVLGISITMLLLSAWLAGQVGPAPEVSPVLIVLPQAA